MTLPFSLGTIPLPDWLPPWVPVVLLIPAVLWLLLLLVMPFAVIGTRSRLDGIEAQLDDLHAELRALIHGGTATLETPRLRRAEDGLPPSPAWPAPPRAEPRIGWSRGVRD